jgi:hypothetical protein
MWWPGTELNRRRQPFQTLFNLNLQHLTWLRETAKYLQIRIRRSNHGLESWAEQARENSLAVCSEVTCLQTVLAALVNCRHLSFNPAS